MRAKRTMMQCHHANEVPRGPCTCPKGCPCKVTMCNHSYRLQFDLTHQAKEEFDALRQLAGAGSGADLFRKALRFYAWYLARKAEGWELVLKKDDKERTVEVLEP